MNGIIGRKLGMTRLFGADGRSTPVTVIEAGPCPVVRVRTREDGVISVQLGFGARKTKHASKAMIGHAKGGGLEAAPRVLREFSPVAEGTKVGDVVTVALFQPGELVKVAGTTKGKGFQGVVHRYHFHGGPATHGNTRHRKPGSISPGTDPSRVIKGKRLPGHMGAELHTEVGLTVVKVDAENHLLFIEGAVPGPKSGTVVVRKQAARSRYA
ncbi:MAG: 50S ribosomal protein L3 [Gemmatimonadetes bacterium]|nr:50S ribosomal protein L3 [Gemmatimonadota bacterium]